MHSEGMRPQLIKLLARWQTLRSEAGVFVQPFSKRLGWLLLQETALRVLPAQKDVTFFDVGDVQLTRIACFRIFRSVERKVRARQSEEARNLDGLYPTQWDLFAAADFGLWSLANEMASKGRSEDWKYSEGWRWKFEDGRASKVS